MAGGRHADLYFGLNMIELAISGVELKLAYIFNFPDGILRTAGFSPWLHTRSLLRSTFRKMDDGVTPSCNCNLDNAATNLWNKLTWTNPAGKFNKDKPKVSIGYTQTQVSPQREQRDPWRFTLKKGHLLGSQRDELWSLVLSSFTPNFSFKVSTWYSNHQILKH